MPEFSQGSQTAEMAIEDYKADIAEAAKRMEYQVQYSQSALRNLNLVNGGAIVALLTFLGNSDGEINMRAMRYAFGWFSAGLGLSLFSYFGAFFSQFFFMNVAFAQAWNAQSRARGLPEGNDFQEDYRRGNFAMAVGIVLATISCVCFIVGSFVALDGMT